jgi:hypothetical protein
LQFERHLIVGEPALSDAGCMTSFPLSNRLSQLKTVECAGPIWEVRIQLLLYLPGTAFFLVPVHHENFDIFHPEKSPERLTQRPNGHSIENGDIPCYQLIKKYVYIRYRQLERADIMILL